MITHGDISQPAVIDGKTYEWKFERKRRLSKSFFIDYSSPIYDSMFSVANEYPFSPTSRTYQVMKVWRKSESGKYFWIMIENFKYKPGDSSYVYNNVEANAQTYGRMYHWEIANECGSKVRMLLPGRFNDGTYTNTTFPTYGHLPTIQDINDVMEVDAIGFLPETGTTIFDFDYDYGYYDLFLSGREFYDEINETAAYHTLGGWLNNTDYATNGFYDLNERSFYWTSTQPSENNYGFHYPLRIYNDDGNYAAFINISHANHYGFYVRYVFEPIQIQ